MPRRVSRPTSATIRPGTESGYAVKPPVDAPTSEPKHILVADDDASIRSLVAHILSNTGFVVEVVNDGAEAWNALMLRDYDLLLTDHEMPHLKGCDLIGRIRSHGPNLPIILMSGTMNAAPSELPPEYRPDTFLPKPFSLSELLRHVFAHVALAK